MSFKDSKDILSYESPFIGYAEFFHGKPPDYSITKILNIKKRELNAFGKKTIKENYDEREINNYLKKLKFGVHAYMQFQDLLDQSLTLADEKDIEKDLFHCRHYCYFESLVYLRQCVIGLLNNNVISSLVLMRPFLELSILNLYWHYLSKKRGVYRLTEWMKGERGKPPFKNSLEYVLKNHLETTSKIKKSVNIIKNHLEKIFSSLSDYNHTPKLPKSIGAKSGGLNIPHLEDFLYSIHMINVIIFPLVLLYTISYPMILFPVDEYRKFGFRGPMNVFADECHFKILAKYLNKNQINFLKKIMKKSDIVQGNLDFYNQNPDLSKKDIIQSWNETNKNKKTKTNNINVLITKHKAKFRGVQWFMNYIQYNEYRKNIDDEISDEEVEKFYDSFYKV